MAAWPTITDGVTRLGNALFTSIKAYIDDLVGGQGLPVGGATNDILAKTSSTNYAAAWTDAPTVDSVTLDTAAAEATGIAKIYWDATEGTVAFGMAGGTVIQRVGHSTFVRAKNTTASTITTGQVVYLTGASGDRPTVALADATDEATSAETIGIAAEDIAVNAEGEICTAGILTGINTYGLTAGTMTFLSETAGAWTQTRPTQPAHGVRLGIPLKISTGPTGTSGVFYVQVNNGYELEELHDVLITSATAGDILKRNAGNTLWVNTAPAALTKTDDTNVTLTLGGSASTALVNAASITAGWTGTLASTRLNSNVVQGVVNDTNVTGSIATQALTLGWTGQLAIARGGTGASSAQAAINALAGATTSGQYLRGNGTNVVMSAIQVADVPTLNQNTTGSAATLTTARTLWGNSFNGSANVDGAITITAALGTGSEAFAIKNTTAGALGNTARMNFYLNNTTDAAAVNTARIEAVSTSAGNRNTDLVFYTAQNLVAPAEQMRLTRDGRLGVGVTPISTAAVDIGTGFTAALALRVTSGGNGIFAFYDSAGTTNYGRILWSAAQVQLNAISNIPLTFFTNNTERMRITNGGDLTVGTTTAQGRITALTSQGTATVANVIMAYGANTSWPMGFSNVYDASFVDSIFSINVRPVSGTRGSVLYNGSTAGYVLYVNGDGTGALDFQSVPGGTNQSATQRMRLTSAGDVGIGTTSPAVRLHVGGGTAPVALGQLLVANTNAAYITVSDGTRQALMGADSGSGGCMFGSLSNHDVYIRTNNTARLSITAAGVSTFSNTVNIVNNAIAGTGGRNYFKDSERSDGNGLRVGAAWGLYGIYAEVGAGVIGGADGVSMQSNAVRLTTAGNFGINTTTPGARLDVGGNALLGPASGKMFIGDVGHGITYPALAHQDYATTTGYAFLAGSNGYTFINKRSAAGSVIGFRKDNSDMMVLTNDGHLAIAPTARLYLDGIGAAGNTYIVENSADNLYIYSGGIAHGFSTGGFGPVDDNARNCGGTGNRWVAVYAVNGTIQTSDRTKKRDIMPTPLGLDFVRQLRPVEFSYVNEAPTQRRQGLIAQEVLALAKRHQLTGIVTGDTEGEYGIHYAGLVPALIAAIQAQDARIAALEAQQ